MFTLVTVGAMYNAMPEIEDALHAVGWVMMNTPNRVPRHFVWRQRNRSRVLGARQLEGFASFLALGFASFLAPAISRKTNDCV